MDAASRKSRKLAKVYRAVDSLCGLYSRVARKLKIHPSYVSRVARGERESEQVEAALLQEFEQVREQLGNA
jgi:transcriptional regulator with XRE-family HTH domain